MYIYFAVMLQIRLNTSIVVNSWYNNNKLTVSLLITCNSSLIFLMFSLSRISLALSDVKSLDNSVN